MKFSPQEVATSVGDADGGVTIAVKVVPGAKRTGIAGMLGDRVKIAVAAPPEGGKANAAVCQLLADVLGIPHRDVAVARGAANPRKRISVIGLTRDQAVTKLLGAMK